MKETIKSSSLFVNIDSLILNFRDGKKIDVSGDGNKSLVVSVIVEEPSVSGFKELVMKHYRSTETVPEWSEKCGYACTKTFNRHFLKHFNETPKQWKLNIREEEMIYLLKHTNSSHEIISSILKFKSLSHFNNFCKKRTGFTPREIRDSREEI